MKSRPYKATSVKAVRIAELVRDREGMSCDVGLDTSKSDVLVVVRWSHDAVERPWRVELAELSLMTRKLQELGEGREMSIAIEPTGTYGDPVRQALHKAGLRVYRVSPKASHDYAEILDGVPSQHDGKDAACVAELSALKKRREWEWDVSTPEIRYEIDWLDAHQKMLTQWLGRLEGLLGRFWPEVTGLLPLSSVTLLTMLEHYGSPEGVAADPKFEDRLKTWSSGRLDPEKVCELVQSARSTTGVRMQGADVIQVQRYAATALKNFREVNRSKRHLPELTKGNEVIARQATVIGDCTATVLWAHLGDPQRYHCAAAYRKAMGLNLKERSSGRWKGSLKITKRGHSQVRRWLYFAALRWCQNPWIRPWYERKKAPGKGYAKRALIGLMRKLALAMYHVGIGKSFDVRRLLPGAERFQRKRKRNRPDRRPRVAIGAHHGD
jgi:transposase